MLCSNESFEVIVAGGVVRADRGVIGESTIDFIRELRLRQWARQHFVPREQRKVHWHSIVLEEMRKRDQEIASIDSTETR